jgi:hypothetical protein
VAKRWARIWFSFDIGEQESVPRRLNELSEAAQNLGFLMEAGRVQDHPPDGQWQDLPEGGRTYAPLSEPDS